MIYLDYSATTPVNKDVLETFNKVCLNYPGNANSIHKLGILSKELEQNATKQIANLLNVDPSSIIYTSGSSESNNLAISSIGCNIPNSLLTEDIVTKIVSSLSNSFKLSKSIVPS